MSPDPIHSSPDSVTATEWERLLPGKRAGWERFCREHIRAIRPFPVSELSKVQGQCDVLPVGSDQVWNPAANTDAYLLFYEKGAA